MVLAGGKEAVEGSFATRLVPAVPLSLQAYLNQLFIGMLQESGLGARLLREDRIPATHTQQGPQLGFHT